MKSQGVKSIYKAKYNALPLLLGKHKVFHISLCVMGPVSSSLL